MKTVKVAALAAALLITSAPSAVAAVQPAPVGRVMPANTNVTVTPMAELSSSRVHVGDRVQFMTVGDTTAPDGAVVIPRGSPVTGTITFVTGRAILGKSGKFDVTFNTVSVGGREYALRGVHRQEGRGNTVGALLGSAFVSGRSGRMTPGQSTATAFTSDPVPY